MNVQTIIPSDLLANKDIVDIKVYEQDKPNLREFLANMFAYQPAWITFLYRVRGVFVRFLGLKQDGVPRAARFSPESIPMEAGKSMSFFRVERAEEDHFWFAQADDSHLSAWLGVVMENQKVYVITLVQYHNWRGWLYFNVIRPFHHVVVHQMAQAGLAL